MSQLVRLHYTLPAHCCRAHSCATLATQHGFLEEASHRTAALNGEMASMQASFEQIAQLADELTKGMEASATASAPSADTTPRREGDVSEPGDT
jgi:hypothetical protein